MQTMSPETRCALTYLLDKVLINRGKDMNGVMVVEYVHGYSDHRVAMEVGAHSDQVRRKRRRDWGRLASPHGHWMSHKTLEKFGGRLQNVDVHVERPWGPPPGRAEEPSKSTILAP